MQAFSRQIKKEGKKIGLVPTMGYLHEGHLSLVKKAFESADIVVVSVFVNPTQFAPNEDFSKYPRDEERDRKLLMELNVDVLFLPSAEEIYPRDYQTYVEVNGITKTLEGESRPTHFKGVTTIVSILFNCVMPDVAVFGQKDAQQAAVIKQMVRDLKFDLEILVAPIVREADGLAMSSRNIFLSAEERKDALVLNSSLRYAGQMISGGISNAEEIIEKMKTQIESVNSAKLDYIRIVDAGNFGAAERLSSGKEYYILIACRIGKTRLIDNMFLRVLPEKEITV